MNKDDDFLPPIVKQFLETLDQVLKKIVTAGDLVAALTGLTVGLAAPYVAPSLGVGSIGSLTGGLTCASAALTIKKMADVSLRVPSIRRKSDRLRSAIKECDPAEQELVKRLDWLIVSIRRRAGDYEKYVKIYNLVWDEHHKVIPETIPPDPDHSPSSG